MSATPRTNQHQPGDDPGTRHRPASATDAALGSLLSWVTGRASVHRGRSALDGALGELLSWLTGRGGKKDPTVRR